MANPKIPILLELREEIENEITQLKTRIQKLEEFIDALNSVITQGSFATADSALAASRAEETIEPTVEEEPDELRSVVLMNKARDLELATLEITQQEIRAIPAPHSIYDIKRGAFARFFVERILGKFQEEDRHSVENDELTWDDAFDFEVRSEDGILEEIVIKNYRTDDRLGEIERALRWALEKTYRAR